ncbi:MAG: hypothetical protein ACKOBT_09310, partial [Actinomycetota bacterium]
QTQQNQFNVLADQFLGTGLRGFRRAIGNTRFELHGSISEATMLVGVVDSRFEEPPNVREVETGATFGVDHADHHLRPCGWTKFIGWGHRIHGGLTGWWSLGPRFDGIRAFPIVTAARSDEQAGNDNTGERRAMSSRSCRT